MRRERNDRPPLASARSRAAERESGTLPRSRATVLIADDDEDTGFALRQILIEEGFDVIEAVDGVQALDLLASAADKCTPFPDVVLLDFVRGPGPALTGDRIARVRAPSYRR